MKPVWKIRKLVDVVDLRPSKAEARAKLRPGDAVSFVPMEHLGIDTKTLATHDTRPLEEVSGSYTYFADGDVLLAKITPCFENGKVGIASGLTNGVGFGSSEFMVLRPHREVESDWLYYFLSQHEFRVEGQRRMSGAVGHKRVPPEYVEGCPFPVPPLPEQRRIVGILDEAFDGITTAKANAERNLRNARDVFQSELSSVFGEGDADWLSATIEEHIRFIDYRGRTPMKTESGIRLITAKNVKMGFVQEEPAEFVAVDSYNEWMTRGIPNKGDVLFTTEAPLANVAQLDTDEKVVFAQRIIIMQPNPSRLDSTFLKYLLLSPPVQRRIRDKGTGATALGIKASLLKKIPIAFPKSVAKQRKLAARLDELEGYADNLDGLCRQKIEALDELKRSLLHHAFAGEL